MKWKPIVLPSLVTFSVVCLMAAHRQGAAPKTTWYKGNTHTHTLWSDGDAPPEIAADWYKSHGYHFLVLSDHNVLSEGECWVNVGEAEGEGVGRPWGLPLAATWIDEINRRFGASWATLREKKGKRQMRLKTLDELRKKFEERNRFLFIQGEEITDTIEGHEVHHNSVNQEHVIPPTGGKSVRDAMQRVIDAVKAEAKRAGRPVLVHLNHPNFCWGVTPDDIAHVLEERFFEVYNGHTSCNNYGDAQHKGMDETWDYVLALRLGKLGGEPLYGLATDDAHNYAGARDGPPGRGWVVVRAKELSPNVITQAMLAGDFYATTGVVLEDITANKSGLAVKIAAQPGVTYTTRFIGTRLKEKKIGDVGAVLQETRGVTATYRFAGDELYVRARIVSSRPHPNGYKEGDLETAWVQPVVPRRLDK